MTLITCPSINTNDFIILSYICFVDEQNSDLKINLKKSEEMPESINVADTTSCHKGEERGEFVYIETLISS